MGLLEITSAVTAVTLVVLLIFLLPVLQELRRTAIALRTFAETMEAEVKPLVKELRDTVADIHVVTSSTAANAEGVNLLLEELGHAGHNVRMINKIIGVASSVVSGSSAWMTGAQVAGRYIVDRLIKKRG